MAWVSSCYKLYHVQWDANHMSYNFDMRNGPVNIEWFKGGTTNICYNCLDRNIERGLGDSPCIIWEGNEPSTPPVPHTTPLTHLP